MNNNKPLTYKFLSFITIFILILSVFLNITTTNVNSQINEKNSKISDILDLIDENLISEYIETLVSLGPRETGTYGCEISGEYIFNKFTSMGLETNFYKWRALGNKYHFRWFEDRNVEATIKSNNSSDITIIFGAHYDSVKKSPGGDDNGGGATAVLAAAYALSNFDFKHTIKLVAFSGEEQGLLGSKAYAKKAYEEDENILVYINADMIAYSKTSEGGKKIRYSMTEDTDWIIDIFDNINNDYNLDFEESSSWEIDRERAGGSDYTSFANYGYESISCWEGEWDPHMHTPEDDLSNVNISYLTRMAKIIAGTIATLADSTDIPAQIKIVSPRYNKLYFERRPIKNLSDLKIKVFDYIWIWTEITPSNANIERVEFYYGNRKMFTDTEPPFKWKMNTLSLRKHRIKVICYDEYGRTSEDYRDIYFYNLRKNN